MRLAARDLAPEEERQAAADEEQRDVRGAGTEAVCVGERCRRRADVVDDDGAEDDEDPELQHRRDREHAERRKRAEQHQRDDRDRQDELEHRPPRLDAGEDDHEHLVDDVRDRVRQVEEVRERPDGCLHERERASGAPLRRSPASPAGETMSRLKRTQTRSGAA